MSTSSPLADFVARHKRRAEAAEQIDSILRDDPDFADELVGYLQSMRKRNGSIDQGQPRSQTHYDVIKAFFEQNDNEWKTAPEIMEATSLERPQVATVLYKSGADCFDSKGHPDHGRMKLWRLKINEPSTAPA